MPRKKRNPSQEKSDYSSDPQQQEETPLQPVEVEIEPHEPKQKSFREKAAEKLSDLVHETGGDVSTQEEKRKSYGAAYRQKRKAKQEQTQGDIATLFSSLIILALAGSSLPERLHPEHEEIDIVAGNLSSILVRHVDLSSKLSGDAIDIIGIVIVFSGWYARVSPEIKRMREERKEESEPALHDEMERFQEPKPSPSAAALERTINE